MILLMFFEYRKYDFPLQIFTNFKGKCTPNKAWCVLQSKNSLSDPKRCNVNGNHTPLDTVINVSCFHISLFQVSTFHGQHLTPGDFSFIVFLSR